MVEAQITNNSSSLVYIVKGIEKEQLIDFAKNYLKKHVYIKSKNLALEYLGVYYNLTTTSTDYDKIRRLLVYRFRRVLSLFVRERLIAGYNNSGLYKRIDLTKTDPDANSKTGPETNKVHLVFHQGKFVNPKYL